MPDTELTGDPSLLILCQIAQGTFGRLTASRLPGREEERGGVLLICAFLGAMLPPERSGGRWPRVQLREGETEGRGCLPSGPPRGLLATNHSPLATAFLIVTPRD
jgi:hypothetical protein